MTPGLLRHRVDLLRPASSAGPRGTTETFAAAATAVPAEIKETIAGEQVLAGAGGEHIVTRHDLSVVLRWRSDVEAGWRLTWRGQTYRVESVVDAEAGSPRRYIAARCRVAD